MALEDPTSSRVPTFAITARLRNSAWLRVAQLLWTGIYYSRRQKPHLPISNTRSSPTFSQNASRTCDHTHHRHSSLPAFVFDKAMSSPSITLDTEQVDAYTDSSNADGTSYQNQIPLFLLLLCFCGDGSFPLRAGRWCESGRSRLPLRADRWCESGRSRLPLCAGRWCESGRSRLPLRAGWCMPRVYWVSFRSCSWPFVAVFEAR